MIALQSLIEDLHRLHRDLRMARELALDARDDLSQVIGPEPTNWGMQAKEKIGHVVDRGDNYGFIDWALRDIARAAEHARKLRNQL